MNATHTRYVPPAAQVSGSAVCITTWIGYEASVPIEASNWFVPPQRRITTVEPRSAVNVQRHIATGAPTIAWYAFSATPIMFTNTTRMTMLHARARWTSTATTADSTTN